MCVLTAVCPLNDRLGGSGTSGCRSYLRGTQSLAVALWTCLSRTVGILHGPPDPTTSTLARTIESVHKIPVCVYAARIYQIQCDIVTYLTFAELIWLIFNCDKDKLQKYTESCPKVQRFKRLNNQHNPLQFKVRVKRIVFVWSQPFGLFLFNFLAFWQ